MHNDFAECTTKLELFYYDAHGIEENLSVHNTPDDT